MKLVTLCLSVAYVFFSSLVKADDYFPSGKLDSFSPNFRDALTHFQEPSYYQLSRNKSEAKMYRITLFPPFSEVFVLTIVVQPNGTSLFNLKKKAQTNGLTNFGPTLRQATLVLTRHNTQHFLTLLQQAHYWSQPSKPPHSTLLDASMWLYESLDRGEYRVVEREEPKIGPNNSVIHETQFEAPAIYLLKLANEELNSDLVN